MRQLPRFARAGGMPAILLEITDRNDLGSNLHAPQSDDGGGSAYELITLAEPGDTVLHYHQPSGGISAISRVASPPQASQILWAAKGATARSRRVRPYRRPSWLVPLTGYSPLNPPVPQDTIRQNRHSIFTLKEQLEDEYGRGLHFPYYRYGQDKLRTLQAYLAVVPRDLLPLLPGLSPQVQQFEAQAIIPPAPPPPADEDLYFADETITVTGTGQVFIDPEARTRANQSHARLQNLLRSRIQAAQGRLHPVDVTANVDLAWLDHAGRLAIAEVKSLTERNEEHQLRYGLGQLIDYRDELGNNSRAPRCVLFIERAPHRVTWIRKCRSVGVELSWPGRWPRLP